MAKKGRFAQHAMRYLFRVRKRSREKRSNEYINNTCRKIFLPTCQNGILERRCEENTRGKWKGHHNYNTKEVLEDFDGQRRLSGTQRGWNQLRSWFWWMIWNNRAILLHGCSKDGSTITIQQQSKTHNVPLQGKFFKERNKR